MLGGYPMTYRGTKTSLRTSWWADLLQPNSAELENTIVTDSAKLGAPTQTLSLIGHDP